MLLSFLSFGSIGLMAQDTTTEKPYVLEGEILKKWTGSETEIDFSNYSDLSAIKQIADEAFKGNTKVTSITKVPMGVSIIGTSAFEGCTALATFAFEKYGRNYDVGGIKKNAFKDCSSLTELIIPRHFKIFEDHILQGTTSLKNVSFEYNRYSYGGKTTFVEGTFEGMNPNLESFTFVSMYEGDAQVFAKDVTKMFGSSVYENAQIKTSPERADAILALGASEILKIAFPKLKEYIQNLEFTVSIDDDFLKKLESSEIFDVTDNKVVELGTKVKVDHELRVTLTPKEGYFLKRAIIPLGGWGKYEYFNEFPFTFKMLAKDIEIDGELNTQLTYGIKGEANGLLKVIFSSAKDFYSEPDEILYTNQTEYNPRKSDARFIFKAFPKKGYRVKEWLKDGEVVEGEIENTYSLSAPHDPTKVEVVFEKGAKQQKFQTSGTFKKITITNKDTGAEVNAGDNVIVGTPLHIAVELKEGYKFKEVQIRDSQNSAVIKEKKKTLEFDYVMPSDEIDFFVRTEYSIIFEATNNIGGKVTAHYFEKSYWGDPKEFDLVSGSTWESLDVGYGNKTVTYTAIPSKGYKAVKWETVEFNSSDEKVVKEIAADQIKDNTYAVTGVSNYKPLLFYVTFEKDDTVTLPTHTCTFSVEGSGATLTATSDLESITTDTQVNEGAKLEFTATLQEGYKVKAWKLNGEVVAGETATTYVTTVAEADVEVKVEVEKLVEYSVSYSVEGDGATLSAKNSKGDLATASKVYAGETVSFTAVLKEGYRVKEWKRNGEVIADEKGAKLSLEVVDANLELVLVVEAIPTHTLSYSVEGEEASVVAIIGGEEVSETSKTLEEGEAVSIVASVKKGNRIKGWKVNGEIQEGKKSSIFETVMGSEDLEIVVLVETITHKVYFEPSVYDGGTLTAQVNGENIETGADVKEGATIDFSISLNPGYEVLSWMVDGKVVEGEKGLTFKQVVGTDELRVRVELQRVICDLTFSVEGGTSTTIAAKYPDGVEISSPAQVYQAEKIIFTATIESGYEVKAWKLNDVVVENVKTNTYEATINDKKTNIVLEVGKIIPKHEVAFSVEGDGGTLVAEVDSNPITSTAQVEEGASVKFTATPAKGYKVKAWKKDDVLLNDQKSTTYTVQVGTEDLKVAVIFEKEIPSYLVEYGTATPERGTVTMINAATKETVASATKLPLGTKLILTAKPAEKYILTAWNVNGKEQALNKDKALELAITLTQDMIVNDKLSISAVFEKDNAVQELKNSIKVYTLAGQLCIEAPANQVVEVYDLSGRQVKRFTTMDARTVQAMSNGIYIVKVCGLTHKIIIR